MRNFLKIFVAIFILIILGNTYAQPELDFSPNRIRFNNIFDRLENIYFINKGDQPLVIDTIYYNSNLYLLRFDKNYEYPFTLQPGDSAKMDCILSGFLWVTASDTADTMFVSNNGVKPFESLKIEIEFFREHLDTGTFNGQITGPNGPISNASVYFFLAGNYLIRRAFTDINGNYSIVLPEASYLIGADADSFYFTYYNQKTDPFKANLLYLQKETAQTINISLNGIEQSGKSISGKIYDSLSFAPLKRAFLVLRKGDHTPNGNINKIVKSLDSAASYTTVLNYDGTYKIEGIIDPGYYFVQSFSDYYVPTYYSNLNNSSVFWQQADSILIETDLNNINIKMPRDSSIGGGSISGNVITNSGTSSTLSDVIIYAKSSANEKLYDYGLSKEDGTYKVVNLPYGNYDLIAQRIGFSDVIVQNINITQNSFDTSGVNIYFILASVENDPRLPKTIELYQNYPNPFNPTTTIEFNLPVASNVTLKIFNMLGEEVALLKAGFLSSGKYKYLFNAGNLSSGTYFINLKTETSTITKKIILLK